MRPAPSPTRVLLVDDQTVVGAAVRRLLDGELSVDLYCCHDPAAAESAAERLRPSVILQDLSMPGADALDLIRQYQANPRTARAAVVALAAESDVQSRERALAAGAREYLVKLPTREMLLAVIRRLACAVTTLESAAGLPRAATRA